MPTDPATRRPALIFLPCLRSLLAPYHGASPMPDLDPPAPPATIGGQIDLTTAAHATATADHDAAIAADEKSVKSAEAASHEDDALAADLALVGPITVSSTDGTFLTYKPIMTQAGPSYHAEVSRGIDTPLPTPPNPEPPPA